MRRPFQYGLAALSLAGALLLALPATADPALDYKLKCMGCHGPEGAAVAGKVPALTNHVARFLDAEGGRAYLVQVPGARQSPLTDKALAELLNWLLPYFDAAHMPENFTPYTEEEVHELRQTRLDHVSAVRAALLAVIEANEKRSAD
jgi:hypothetical protein